MDKHLLMKVPIYLLALYSVYSTYKGYKAQSEWNPAKKWNLAGCILFTLGTFLYIYEDFLME